jgi:hypothetical protein
VGVLAPILAPARQLTGPTIEVTIPSGKRVVGTDAGTLPGSALLNPLPALAFAFSDRDHHEVPQFATGVARCVGQPRLRFSHASESSPSALPSPA